MTQKIEISHRTIIFTILFLISMYLVFILRDVIIGLFVSILVTSALTPFVAKLEKFRIPRPVGILLSYTLFIGIFALAFISVVPLLLDQLDNLVKTLPLDFISEQLKLVEVNLENIQLITNQLGSFSPLVKIVTGTFSSIITFFTLLVIIFYLLMERKDLHKHLVALFGNEQEEAKMAELIDQVDHQIGSWLRGQFLLMIIVGVIIYIGLTLLSVPYALSLAILAGALEIIPNIGPTISAIPSILVALTLGNPFIAIFVVILYVLVQQLENNLIVPKIMQSSVGIHPLVTILSIIVGLKLAGIPGAMLAVPVFLVVRVIFTVLIQPKLK